MRANRRVVAVAGISGAGKTTLIRRISGFADFAHLTASDLIKEQIKREGGVEQHSELLRSGDILDNQTLLIEAFGVRSSAIEGHIVLDCHTIIDAPNGLQPISSNIFEAIGVTDFLFLKIDPMEIQKRRGGDLSRPRPERSVAELAAQQNQALQVAREVAEALDIPFTVLEKTPEAELLSVLESLFKIGPMNSIA